MTTSRLGMGWGRVWGWLGLCAPLWVACGQHAQAQTLRTQGNGYELQVLVDGRPETTFAHRGEDYVLGQLGARYTLRVINHSGRRIEAVVSVDGLDVIDGKRADFKSKRGYLVPAWGSVDIDGWRLNAQQVAAFRFSATGESYAARTGSARNVGVIGAAIFEERYIAPPPRPIMPYAPREPAADSSFDLQYEGRAESRADAPAASSEALRSERGRSAGAAAAPQKRRSGLGTEFGEARSSHVTEVEFVRARSSVPSQVLGLRYDDRDGLIAIGVELEPRCDAACREADLRRSASPFVSSNRRYAAPPSGWRGRGD